MPSCQVTYEVVRESRRIGTRARARGEEYNRIRRWPMGALDGGEGRGGVMSFCLSRFVYVFSRC